MKNKVFVRFIVLLSIPFMVNAAPPILVKDNLQNENVNQRFRKGSHISACAQFSAPELQIILEKLDLDPSNLWIIDLRQEPHGFINGMPISLYSYRNQENLNKSAATIASEERAWLDGLKKNKEIAVYDLVKGKDGDVSPGKKQMILIKQVQSEEELVTDAGARYQRFYVLDHHRPDDQNVDNFVNFVRNNLDEHSWVHFHCRGGKGRSSTFVAMLYMLRNPKEGFDDTLQKLVDMGNKDLANFIVSPGKEWKSKPARERYRFLKDFYQYAIDSKAGYTHNQSWSKWLQSRKDMNAVK